MLAIKIENEWTPITGYSEFYISKSENGTETLSFDISKMHPLFNKIKTEMLIQTDDNEYLVTGINLPSTIATITGELNLQEWKQEFYFKCSDIPALSTKLLVDVLEYIKPAGWSIINAYIRDIRRTPDTEKCNGYDILMRCRDIYNIWYDIDCLSKTIYVVDPNDTTDTGAYVTPELNMTGISYKESSTERVTRLYCYGKEDMTFSDINDGKPYVECFDYTSDVLVGGWSDQRYDVKENFLADALKKVKEQAMPIGSYTIDIKDLAEVDDRYTYINLALRHTVHCIINPEKEIELIHRVVNVQRYPDEPERKIITLSNEPQRIENQIDNIISAVGEDGQKITGSILQQAQKKAMELINNWATDGYVYLTENEIYILDKIPKEEAKYCIRMNLGGIAFSQQGWAGPYISAWTIDGKFNADFITAGTLRGIRITNGNNFNVDANGNVTANGLKATNAEITGDITGSHISGGDITGTLFDGGTIKTNDGNIGGWNIDSGGLYNGAVKIKNSGITNIYTWADLYIIRLIITGVITADADMIAHYDFNGDGGITPADYVILKNRLKAM
ncbi:dockerin [Erysipelotrichaceae bacterium AF15-26LB]|nr:phage tail protein [[Clostridium] innocuum]RJV87121.1 dockerin [Erysipelotrichaceae bacterium AF15-26LB]